MVVIKQQVSWSCNPWGLDPLGVIELASVVFFLASAGRHFDIALKLPENFPCVPEIVHQFRKNFVPPFLILLFNMFLLCFSSFL